jgi:hypothetical protein
VACQLGATRGLARLAAGNGGRVEQPEPVAEAGRGEREQVDGAEDLRGQRAHTLVVARLLRQVGKQVAEAPARKGQEPAVVGAVEQDLGDGQGDELGVRELGRPAGTGSLGQEIVQPDVKCGDEGVEVGAHAASSVDVVVATSNFGVLTSLPRRPMSSNSESII